MKTLTKQSVSPSLTKETVKASKMKEIKESLNLFKRGVLLTF